MSPCAKASAASWRPSRPSICRPCMFSLWPQNPVGFAESSASFQLACLLAKQAKRLFRIANPRGFCGHSESRDKFSQAGMLALLCGFRKQGCLRYFAVCASRDAYATLGGSNRDYGPPMCRCLTALIGQSRIRMLKRLSSVRVAAWSRGSSGARSMRAGRRPGRGRGGRGRFCGTVPFRQRSAGSRRE